jgi:uncharacterized protein (DUF1697 family)
MYDVHMRLAAFLRGINVGGTHTVPMAALKARWEGLGLTGVKTLLNSGNVVFEAGRATPARLEAQLAKDLLGWLGFEVEVLVRTADELERLLAHRPTVLAGEKSYALFLSGTPRRVTLPVIDAKEGMALEAVVDRVALVRSLPTGSRPGASMNFVQKTLGVSFTSRNWNTVEKVLALLQA